MNCRLNKKGLFHHNWTEDVSDEDEDKQTEGDLVHPPGPGSLGPSHNQPLPGNFSLVKRQDQTESGSKSASATTRNVKKAAVDRDRNEPFIRGNRRQGKDKHQSPKKTDEGKETGRREEGRRGGGGGEGGGGGGREGEGGGKGREDSGGVEGRGRGGGGGGGKPGEQRFHQSKERHKGSRANHNRRALADRKRDRGMGGAPARY